MFSVGPCERGAEPRPKDADNNVEIRCRLDLRLEAFGELHRFVLPEIGFQRDGFRKLVRQPFDQPFRVEALRLYVTRGRDENAKRLHEDIGWSISRHSIVNFRVGRKAVNILSDKLYDSFNRNQGSGFRS